MASNKFPSLPSHMSSMMCSGQKSTLKRTAGKHDMLKRKIQKKAAVQAGTTKPFIAVKKAVNGYIVFRSSFSQLFPASTQSQRSTFVRILWEKEQHKTSYSLMGKAWTFLRDSSSYRDFSAFIAGAQRICGVVLPEKFFQVHNLNFVAGPDHTIQLIQTAPTRPGSITAPRDLSDFELLREILEDGLPVENPIELGKALLESQQHTHTVNLSTKSNANTKSKKTYSFIQETPAVPGRADVGFTSQMDYDPFATCSELLQLDSNHIIFDSGINVVDCSDITTFDPSSVFASGPQTHHRFEWDTTTKHIAQPECVGFDLAHVENNIKMYDMCQPNMFEQVINQTKQKDFLAAQPEEEQSRFDVVDDFDMNEFFMATAFDEEYPSFVLE